MNTCLKESTAMKGRDVMWKEGGSDLVPDTGGESITDRCERVHSAIDSLLGDEVHPPCAWSDLEEKDSASLRLCLVIDVTSSAHGEVFDGTLACGGGVQSLPSARAEGTGHARDAALAQVQVVAPHHLHAVGIEEYHPTHGLLDAICKDCFLCHHCRVQMR
jgi:hypothetical protein